MKDIRLVDLNFREIVDYGGQPPVRNEHPRPLDCQGYCISCEESGLLAKTGGRLDLMSHGCDSADYETVLGPMPREGAGVAEPVLFLLENPGAKHAGFNPVEFRGYRKHPPVNHYWWSPNIKVWPRRVVEFNGNFYGPYFAYLMRRHQLLNVYITNLVKCKWVDGKGKGTPEPITTHCTERFLTRELQIFAPRVVFCFGGEAKKGFRDVLRRDRLNYQVVELLHPSYICDRWQTRRPPQSQEELVLENDDRVQRGISQFATVLRSDCPASAATVADRLSASIKKMPVSEEPIAQPTAECAAPKEIVLAPRQDMVLSTTTQALTHPQEMATKHLRPADRARRVAMLSALVRLGGTADIEVLCAEADDNIKGQVYQCRCEVSGIRTDKQQLVTSTRKNGIETVVITERGRRWLSETLLTNPVNQLRS